MNARDRIDQVLEKKGVSRGGERYLRVPDARELVAEFKEAGWAITGIEAVELLEDVTRPLMDTIADFSKDPDDTWNGHVLDCAWQARNFLDTLPDRETIFVTLTALSQDEWEQNTGARFIE